MLLRILTIAYAALSTMQMCTPGCLKCNSTGTCLISDTSNFYRLGTNSAAKVIQPNCKLVLLNGDCVYCATGFYSDSSSSTCVAVSYSDIIDHCAIYASYNTCSQCAEGYYLSDSTCAVVTTIINHCAFYSTISQCSKCQSGYLLSLDKSQCVPISLQSNCGQYSFILCNSCIFGYVVNPNNYLNTFLNTESQIAKSALTDFAQSISKQDPNQVPQLSCQAQSTNNCATFDNNTSSCLTCQTGYYLDSNSQCVAFPDEPIENCLHYASGTACSECVQGFYIMKDGSCVYIQSSLQINDCISYDGTAKTVSCIDCKSDFYLSNNMCSRRIFSRDGLITNCAAVDPVADKCGVCKPLYYLTNNGKSCLEQILNCDKYLPSSADMLLRCAACKSGYFITYTNTTQGTVTNCVEGGIDNCSTYVDESPLNCAVCENKYVLKLGVCTLSNNINGCTQYSTTSLNACSQCDVKSSYNFIVESVCQTTTSPIPYCVQYSGGTLSSPICSQCASGYYLNSNSCVLLNIDNCNSMNANLCIGCNMNFAISASRTACGPPLEYISDQCTILSTGKANNTEFITDVTCLTCNENAVPINFKNLFACVAPTDLNLFSSTTSAVDDCVKYDRYLQCVQCDTESARPYLNTMLVPPTCVPFCNSAVSGPFSRLILNTTSDTSTTYGDIYQYNICINGVNATPNCLIYAPDISRVGGQICIFCSTNRLPVIDMADNAYSNVDPLSSTRTTYIPSAFARFPRVVCPALSSVSSINGVVSNSVPAGCAYFMRTGNNTYACVRCKHTFTSVVSSSDFISNCKKDDNCSPNRFYNLDQIWSNLTTCHKCNDSNTIPFIAYQAISINNPTFVRFQQWDTSLSNGDFARAGSQLSNMECLINDPSTFGLSSSNYGIDPNCGLGAILTNTNGSGNNFDQFGTFCAACNPGYSAISHSLYSFVKTSCALIPNCSSTSTYFNACSDCLSGFIHQYSNGINFSKCLIVPPSLIFNLENCYAATADATGTSAVSCSVCNTGYTLNADQYCEQYVPANCQPGAFRTASFRSSMYWDWSLWLAGNSPGCNKCTSKYSAVQIAQSTNVCVQSTWLSSIVYNMSPAQTNYVPNCKNYSSDSSNIHCTFCSENYVISGDVASRTTGKACFISTSLPNCIIAKNATTCIRCISSNFGLVAGVCMIGSIYNCAAYNNLTNSSAVRCMQCVSGYFLNTFINSCFPGLIYHCIAFQPNNPYGCTVCESNYTLVSVGDSNVYCYPNDSSLGCDKMSLIPNAIGGRVSCITCPLGSNKLPFPKSLSSNQTICMSFVNIPNCSSYKLGSTLATSVFQCTACLLQFYLSANTCASRLNLDPRCVKYVVDSDSCSICDDTSYLSADSLTCISYPTGIIGCSTYVNLNTCSQCKTDRYLSNNTCVKTKNLIYQCDLYSADAVCSSCKANYFLINNTCVAAAATNCVTLSAPNRCSSCPKGAVLVEKNNITNCEAKTVTGCQNLDINSPYPCLLCNDGYYLLAGQCFKPNSIANCSTYDSATTCLVCVIGYALTADRASCISSENIQSYIDPKCRDSRIISTAICSRCSSGYYFVNGTCNGSCNSALISRCLACDPNIPQVCFICAPGYYMTRDGACTPNYTPLSQEIGGSTMLYVSSIALLYYLLI